jgi:hypothetical protein
MGSLPFTNINQTITARRLSHYPVQEADSDVPKVSNEELSTFTSQDQRTGSCQTLHCPDCPVTVSPCLATLQADRDRVETLTTGLRY